MLFELLLLAASVVIQDYLSEPPDDAQPEDLGDIDVTTTTEGRVIPIVFGRCRIDGLNTIWYGDFRQEAITEKIGLLFKKRYVVGYRYYLGIQFAVCRGPGVTLRNVLINDEVAYTGLVVGGFFDISQLDILGGDDLGTGGIIATCDFYPGSTTQLVNEYLNDPARQQVSAATPTAPRYTGTCYVVAREMTSAAPTASDRGAYLGNSPLIEPWSFEVERYPALFSGQSTGENKVGLYDCNPMNVLYELLTNTEWGLGQPSSRIDVGAGSSFLAASDRLIIEGNGFSILFDSSTTADSLKAEIERQIDGVVYIDHEIGKWVVHLARDASDPDFGYDVNTVPQMTDDTISELRDYSPGTWKDTINQVQVSFNKRTGAGVDDYKETFAQAQNSSNAVMLSGGSITEPRPQPTIIKYPGCKLSTLAADLAWRDLRARSRPLMRATFVTTRESYDVKIGGVVAWTDTRKGYNKVPMRVTSVDYGSLTDGKVTIKTVEDVFRYLGALAGAPPNTRWTPPTISLVAYPSDEQLAEEAPRGIVVRDPDFTTKGYGSPDIAMIMVSARRQGSETAFNIDGRIPAAAYTTLDSMYEFGRIGSLTSDLAAGTAVPTTTITISPGPDSQTALEELFNNVASVQDLGVSLANLIKIDNEYMLVSSAADSGLDVDLSGVYRGALDSGQAPHTAGADVRLLFTGLALAPNVFPHNSSVDIQLRMFSSATTYAGAVTTIALTLAKRTLRPYPPAAISHNGSSTAFNVPDLEGDGAGLNGVGFDVDLRRRRFDTADEVNEMLQDNAVDASTEHRVQIFVDPAGVNTQVYDSGWFSTVGVGTRPTQAYVVNPAAAGTLIRIQVDARHDYFGETNIESRYSTYQDTNPTSTRTSQFYLGGDLAAGTISNVYTAAANGTYTVNIGAAYAVSVVQSRINGGPGWSTVIAAGFTTGTIAGVVTTDTIELKHLTNEVPARNFVEIRNPSAVAVAYGVLTDGT